MFLFYIVVLIVLVSIFLNKFTWVITLIISLFILLLLINIMAIIIDICYTLMPKKQAKVTVLKIHEEKIGIETFYFLNIIYEYEQNGQLLTSSKLNIFNNVMRKKRIDIEDIVNNRIKDGYIDIYVNPYLHNQPYAFPLKWHKLVPCFMIGTSIIFLSLLTLQYLYVYN